MQGLSVPFCVQEQLIKLVLHKSKSTALTSPSSAARMVTRAIDSLQDAPNQVSPKEIPTYASLMLSPALTSPLCERLHLISAMLKGPLYVTLLGDVANFAKHLVSTSPAVLINDMGETQLLDLSEQCYHQALETATGTERVRVLLRLVRHFEEQVKTGEMTPARKETYEMRCSAEWLMLGVDRTFQSCCK